LIETNFKSILEECELASFKWVPIFSCCNKVYGCYLCHNENENHENKEVKEKYCVKCSTINEIDRNICKKCKIKFNWF